MIEVFPGVFMFSRTQGSNVFYVQGKTGALIDAGLPMDRRRIARQLRAFGFPAPGLMVATHYHLDHMGAIHDLKLDFSSWVAAHATDRCFMEGDVPGRMYRVRPSREVYYRLLSPLFKYIPVEVDIVLLDGDVLDVMGGLDVIGLPGHTEGSMALYQRDKGLLFTGGTIRNERNALEGPPPAFSPAAEESYWHIREKLLALDFETLLPGHGEPVTGGGRDAVELMMRRLGRLE